MDKEFIVINKEIPQEFFSYIDSLQYDYIIIVERLAKKRTLKQNRALHKWFTQIAELFNEKGIDMRKIFEVCKKIDIPVTMESIKEIWRYVQKIALNKESTTELTTKEMCYIQEIFIKGLSILGCPLPPFPSMETLSLINQNE